MAGLLEEIRGRPDAHRAGAIACFIGVVRGIGHNGSRVVKLEYEAHERLAEEELRRIAEEVASRPGVIDVSIHHNVDTMSPGDDILYVLVMGVHREDVFWGVQTAVEELKKRAPIWKKEHTEGGSYWVSGR